MVLVVLLRILIVYKCKSVNQIKLKMKKKKTYTQAKRRYKTSFGPLLSPSPVLGKGGGHVVMVGAGAWCGVDISLTVRPRSPSGK